jgi:hypothetical protein
MADYCSAAEVKAQPDITGTDSDTIINAFIGAASRTIDGFCNRPDGFVAPAVAAARYFVGNGKPYLFIDEFATASGLAVAVKDSPSDDEDDYVTWTVGVMGTTTEADVFPATGDPKFPDYNHTPYTMLLCGANGDYSVFTAGHGLPTVKVTARWGYAVQVPAQIKQATIIQVSRWLKRGQSGWADSIGNGETGTLDFRKALDPDVQLILKLGRFVRPAV